MLSTRLCFNRLSSRSTLIGMAFACAYLPALPATAQQNGGRERLSLDAGWRFRVTPGATLDQKTSIADWTWTRASANEIGDVSRLDETKHTWQPATLGQDVFDQKP